MIPRKEILRLAKFSAVGLAAILTDFGVYNGLLLVLPFAWLAKGISFCAGGVVAYLFNKYWTFQQNQRSYIEMIKFAVVNTLGLGLNVAVNQLTLAMTSGNTVIGFAAATAIAGGAIYLGQRLWVFTSRGWGAGAKLPEERE